MKQSLSHETYPLYTLEVDKENCDCKNTNEIILRLKESIEAHELASFIDVFDHLQQARLTPAAQINDNILDAKSILFCFGLTLPTPQITATNPRSIGVVELDDEFVITFLETPMPLANTTMEKWAQQSLA